MLNRLGLTAVVCTSFVSAATDSDKSDWTKEDYLEAEMATDKSDWIKKEFESLDTNQDGAICWQDLKTFDADKDGALDLTEFTDMVQSKQTGDALDLAEFGWEFYPFDSKQTGDDTRQIDFTEFADMMQDVMMQDMIQSKQKLSPAEHELLVKQFPTRVTRETRVNIKDLLMKHAQLTHETLDTDNGVLMVSASLSCLFVILLQLF
eukprot:232546_1